MVWNENNFNPLNLIKMRFLFLWKDCMIEEWYRVKYCMRTDNNICYDQTSLTRDSLSTHSLTVRQLNPWQGKNCKPRIVSTAAFKDRRARRSLCISVTKPSLFIFQKAHSHGGLIARVSNAARACVYPTWIERDKRYRDGRFQLARARGIRWRWMVVPGGQ